MIKVFVEAYRGYANYLWQEITHPSWDNYFYWLIGVSLFFFLLEILKPWRKDQPILRKDFWLDLFYVFFNFFLFSLIIYHAASDVVVHFFEGAINRLFSIRLSELNPMYSWPLWAILLVGFVVRDFVQWWTHRLLHRVSWLWEFHKVHHSVEQMGFAAHLRYHWMETIVYRTIEYLPLALLGIGLHDFFIIHIFTLAVGHFNHSNITVSPYVSGGVIGGLVGLLIACSVADIAIVHSPSLIKQLAIVTSAAGIGSLVLGPWMRVLFNSPEMHLYHHAHALPESHRYGVNFGLTLAIWDYIWGTAHLPEQSGNVRLGFEGLEEFPTTFTRQITHGFTPQSGPE